MDENTTLGDLLELQLHRVEEEVKNIVDKAVKEMGIEKVERFQAFLRNFEAFQGAIKCIRCVYRFWVRSSRLGP